MNDPRFHRAVIFMCAHDKNGAMGLIVNHALPGVDMTQLLKQLNIPENEKNTSFDTIPVMGGGPVESARGFILHSPEFSQTDTVKINPSFSVTGTVDALKDIAAGEGPEKMLFILGYAGWSPGQLDREIKQNVWLIGDASPDLVFAADHQTKWDKAVKALGIDPAMLSGHAGRA